MLVVMQLMVADWLPDHAWPLPPPSCPAADWPDEASRSEARTAGQGHQNPEREMRD